MDQNHEGFLGEEHVYGSNLRNQEVISAARARGFPLLQGIPWHRKSTGHCGQYTNVCSVLGNKVGEERPRLPRSHWALIKRGLSLLTLSPLSCLSLKRACPPGQGL